MCPRPKIANLDNGDMDFALFTKIIDDICSFANNKTSFTLVGLGESLLYPRLPDAITHVKRKCSKSPVILDTNGVLLDDTWAYILTEGLGEGDRILISLNTGNPDTYKWLMGADKYDVVVNNIMQFLSIRNKKSPELKVVIQILQTKRTESEIEDFKRFWSSFIGSKDKIYVRPLLNWGGKIDVDALSINKKRVERYPCRSLWIAIAIDKDGNVYPCCEAFSSRKNSNLFLGNASEKSIAEIYFEKIKFIRSTHLEGRYRLLPECIHCDFYTYYPNIWRSKTVK